jgi:Holliday junction resolvasome RuvABC endonuclease subunit
MKPRRVMGLDLGGPGAAVVLTPNGSLGSVLHYRRLPKGLNLAQLREIVGDVMEAFEVDLVVTERPFIGGYHRVTASQREKFSVVKTLCQERGVQLVSYGPPEVKKACTGNGRASKEQMMRAAKSLLGFHAPDEHCADGALIALVGMGRAV